MFEFAFPGLHTRTDLVDDLVQDLLAEHLRLWWNCDRSLPHFHHSHSRAEQVANEKHLESLVEGLVYEIKHAPQSTQAREDWQKKLRDNALAFAQKALALPTGQLEFLESSGMIEAAQEFTRMARRFDPRISTDDIYQAARNVMSMNFIQLLLGLPVEVTPSVFAYSMLYPYTDNYLDDPAIPGTTKLAFNHRLRERLKGETIRPQNEYEAIISQLVGMIEGQFERTRYPQVYESLLAIHAAQARSLRLVAPHASPFELDVLGISFEKGGTSVLADGYLVAGNISHEQAMFFFGYGAFTQLIDDLEDIASDRREGRVTIFSQTSPHWRLDNLTNHLIHFGRAIFADLSAFQAPSAAALKGLIVYSLDPLIIDTAGRAGSAYSKEYLQTLEMHLPFRFTALRKQREKLERSKVGLGKLMEAFFLDEKSQAGGQAQNNLVENSKIRASAAHG